MNHAASFALQDHKYEPHQIVNIDQTCASNKICIKVNYLFKTKSLDHRIDLELETLVFYSQRLNSDFQKSHMHSYSKHSRLIFSESVGHVKMSNVKCHYEAIHSRFELSYLYP